MGWQWHQLDHMQIICTSFQSDNQASTSPLSFCRPDALPAAQPTRQTAEGKSKEIRTRKYGHLPTAFISNKYCLLVCALLVTKRWINYHKKCLCCCFLTLDLTHIHDNKNKNHLLALYPQQARWASTRKKTFIYSLPIFVCITQYF